jgi:2-methylaconitate cis-trans-isomerase PrpF
VAQGLATSIENSPAIVRIEHPSGQMEVTVNFSREDGSFQFRSAGVIRTARLIARGEVLVPSKVWSR